LPYRKQIVCHDEGAFNENPKKIPIKKPVTYSMEFVFFILLFQFAASGCRTAGGLKYIVGTARIPPALVCRSIYAMAGFHEG
jgi:hypothetical protein